jgi:hypothetical protein
VAAFKLRNAVIGLLEFFEILVPTLSAHQIWRSRIVSRCGKARFLP